MLYRRVADAQAIRHLKHGIDQLQHWRRGAEGDGQRHIAPFQPASPRRGAKLLAAMQKALRVSTLKAIDRLFRIAHGEQCPPPLVAAGKELGDQTGDHLPLRRVGILSLVDEDVVDAAIQFKMHPGRARIDQQPRRAQDEVVIVQQ